MASFIAKWRQINIVLGSLLRHRARAMRRRLIMRCVREQISRLRARIRVSVCTMRKRERKRANASFNNIVVDIYYSLRILTNRACAAQERKSRKMFARVLPNCSVFVDAFAHRHSPPYQRMLYTSTTPECNATKEKKKKKKGETTAGVGFKSTASKLV